MVDVLNLNALKRLLVAESNVEADEIEPTALLVEDLGLDSLDALRIAAGLDEEYGVLVTEEHLARVSRIEDLLRVINELMVSQATQTDADDG